MRLRGEISKVTRHSSGHVYLTLKDDKANIDGVIWKGQVRGLQAQPDTGLEVIVTGRITTFPASSKYQIVIEQMEVAGVGALLAQLERLKQKLHGEGLFEVSKKQPPALRAEDHRRHHLADRGRSFAISCTVSATAGRAASSSGRSSSRAIPLPPR